MTTVDIPQIGKVKKEYVYGGLALTAGFVGYRYYVSRGSSASDTAIAVDPNNIDTSGVSSTDSFTNPNPLSPVDTPGASNIPRTNVEWSNMAVDKMANLGYDPTLVSDTIGKYLDRKGLNSQEAQIIRNIWAQVGRPPEGSYSIIPVQNPPTTPSSPPTNPRLPIKVSYRTGGGFGTTVGHAVDTKYLQGTGYLDRNNRFTGKGGTPKGHPFSYSYGAGLFDKQHKYFLVKG